ncbi:aspartate aminotransferase, mitochondrial-like [Diaphorina citri]|uniref:Aspartate aminotransferase n=1 Tax=Diaphorina citri TaxID=121845 RepID=A0A1S3DUW9_DIACI|nr:aspartate aminotransferase, mitochondrial-like [Diaphorina citri]
MGLIQENCNNVEKLIKEHSVYLTKDGRISMAGVTSKNLAIVQGISGSGSLRVGTAFLERFYPGVKTVYFPTPTWNGHVRFCTDSRLNVGAYRYFDNKTNGLDFAGMMEDIKLAIVQGISGSGSLRVGTAFLERFYPGVKTVYFPTPTWNGHVRFCTDSRLNVGAYRYFDNKTNGLDFAGMMEDIKLKPLKQQLKGFNKDPHPKKMNLGVGAYRGEDGKPYVLPSVKEAERRIYEKNLDHEYANIGGDAKFCKLAAQLAYGEDFPAFKDNRLAIVQGISGSGSLRVGTAFLERFYPGVKTVYFPTPTWNGHVRFCTDSRLNVGAYRYFDNKTNGLDFAGMMEDIKAMPERSILFLQTSSHNPTGVDLSEDQWRQLAVVVKQRHLYPFFDMAYLGLTSGDFDKDAFSLRYFAKEVGQLCLAQSFSKNMGLYGERVGTFSVLTPTSDETERIMSQLKILIRGFYSNPPIHGARIVTEILSDPKLKAQCLVNFGERVGTFSVLTPTSDETERIMSQLKILIRGFYSNPPIHGARIVTEILSDPKLKAQWFEECKGMSNRISSIREELKSKILDKGSKKNWDHITNQKGMFCYTGLSASQVQKLIKEHSVHLTNDGRISLGAVNRGNVEYLAGAMHAVTKD